MLKVVIKINHFDSNDIGSFNDQEMLKPKIEDDLDKKSAALKAEKTQQESKILENKKSIMDKDADSLLYPSVKESLDNYWGDKNK